MLLCFGLRVIGLRAQPHSLFILCSPPIPDTMPQGNKTVSDHAKSASKAIWRKIKPYSSSHPSLSTPSTASELIKAHLQSNSTKRNYSSAHATAHNWLRARIHEHCGDEDPCSEEAVSNAKNETLALFHHKDAPIAFKKPVEVTASLLSAYITFCVTKDHVSVSTVDTIQAAFKCHFKDM